MDQAPPELAEPTVAVPDVFLGMSYDDALQAAIDANIAELVWVGKTILSPSGEKAVYSTNKNDLVHGTFSLVLLVECYHFSRVRKRTKSMIDMIE